MTNTINGTLIIVVFFLANTISVAQVAGMQRVEQKPDTGMSNMLDRFSQAIIETGDTDKIKDQLFDSLIFALVRQGDTRALEALAKRGDKLEYRDFDDNSLLHVAAAVGAEQMVKFLIDNGVEVDVDNVASRSPLFLAAQENHLGTVRLLLMSGANADGNSQLSHPLNTAAWYGHSEMVTLLLENKASVNERDVDGNTALHKAVWQGHYLIVEQLLQYDADPNVTNDAGQTPLSMAQSRIEESKTGTAEMRRWGTEQVLGPPNAGNRDDPKAWASQSQDNQAEWLIVQFAEAVIPASVEIYENLAPKAVHKISVFDSKGKEHVAWKGKDPAEPNASGVHVAKITLDPKVAGKIKTNKIRIHIDSVAVKGWNEIDAVQLSSIDGKNQWASWADASSCYATEEFPWKKYQLIHDLIVSEN